MAKKRVHEIAKEKGISSKEVLAVLQGAGIDVALVHFTAPTIHAEFDGTITLELINLGPLDIAWHRMAIGAVASSPPSAKRFMLCSL